MSVEKVQPRLTLCEEYKWLLPRAYQVNLAIWQYVRLLDLYGVLYELLSYPRNQPI